MLKIFPQHSDNYIGRVVIMEEMQLTAEQKKELLLILEGNEEITSAGNEKIYIDSIKYLLYKNRSQNNENSMSINKKLLSDFYFMLLGINVKDNNRSYTTSILYNILDNEIITKKLNIRNLENNGKNTTYQKRNLQYYKDLCERFSLTVENFILSLDDN